MFGFWIQTLKLRSHKSFQTLIKIPIQLNAALLQLEMKLMQGTEQL